MDKIKELEKSQQIQLSNDFYELIENGILFNPKHGLDKFFDGRMSASILIHHWNHSKFLPMLFESFECMDKNNIECQFIITDSGSSKEEIENVKKLLDNFQGKLKIDFLIHELNDLREEFNKNNLDGTFHGFPYISNSALNFCKNDVHVICDSSNIVNYKWLQGLVSPHYLYYNEKLIIKSRGGDYTPESTLELENKNFSIDYFELPHTYHEFQAGRGFGWSIKTKDIIELGGFRHLLSSCGGVDDDFIFRAVKLDKFKFFGHKESFALHRIHNEGYEKNSRKPNWAYKQLKKLYIENLEENKNPKIEFDPTKPIETFRNY